MRLFELSDTEDQPSIDGTYVAARFQPETVINLDAFQADHRIPNPVAPQDFHTTIVHSCKPIFWRPEPDVDRTAQPIGFDIWETQSGARCLVLLLDSPYLHQRWQVAQDRGAQYDFDQYRPHITLSYDVGGEFTHEHLPVPDFEIKIAHEYVEPLVL
jgi:hypothetical protein